MFSTHDQYDTEWEHQDTGRTASFSRDDCDESCQGTDDCDCGELARIEKIEALADRMLKMAKYESLPATEVYDLASEKIDAEEGR